MFSLKVDDELELCLPHEDRVEEAYSLIISNYEHIKKWSRWRNEDFSLEAAREYCRQSLQTFESKGDKIDLRIIFGDKIAGTTGYHNIDRRSRSAEIGYWISKEYEGRGLVTRSVTRLLGYGFDELALNRVVIKCAVENVKSRAIPERLGFTQEGIEREADCLQTKFVDQAVYSLLEREWRARNA